MTNSAILSADDALFVSQDAFDSEDAYDILESNIAFVNALFDELLAPEEISRAALTSYYVDYYSDQVDNGGFSQFVFNSGWEADVVAAVREGLHAMGAIGHLNLFDQGAAVLADLSGDELESFLQGDYFGEDAVRDRLDETGTPSSQLSRKENLVELNAAWVRQHPRLQVLSLDQLQEEIDRRAAAVPDREAREQQAAENQPEYLTMIEALCEASGQTLERVTAGDINEVFDGKTVRERGEDEAPTGIIWYFITDAGLHLMAQADGKAYMLNADTRKIVAEIDE